MGTNRSADAPAGYDEEDPYADVALEQFAPWWRQNIRLFKEHDMRPYRPPQFADGVHTPDVLEALEDEFDVSVQFRVVDPQEGNDWEVRLDDKRVETVERYRDDGGFSVYDIDSNTFEQLVRAHLK